VPVLLDMAVSLDGMVSRADGSVDDGLHDWYFDPTPVSKPIVDELVETSGSLVLGRNAFGSAGDEGGWNDTPYDVPHFVVSHRPLPPAPPGRTVEFIEVASIEEAIARATEAAGSRYATIGGGADIAHQCLAAGLVDEVQLHVVPVVFGRGLRLFDDSTAGWALRPIRVVGAPNVTHLRYAVERP